VDHLLLPPHLSTVATARHFAASWARGLHLGAETVDRLELLTSELVANAVAHGVGGGANGPVLLGLSHVPAAGDGPATLLLCVTDTGRTSPTPRSASPDDERGRGLALVQLLAHSWGHTLGTPPGRPSPPVPLASAGVAGSGGGKTVWCTLLDTADRTRAVHAPASRRREPAARSGPAGRGTPANA
jgi:anti-sigma regulatory factor (Ser/Thr protein kinase)